MALPAAIKSTVDAIKRSTTIVLIQRDHHALIVSISTSQQP